MSMVAELGENGLWCPHCGEFLEIDESEFDAEDTYNYNRGYGVYYVCPECGDSFYIEKSAEAADI